MQPQRNSQVCTADTSKSVLGFPCRWEWAGMAKPALMMGKVEELTPLTSVQCDAGQVPVPARPQQTPKAPNTRSSDSWQSCHYHSLEKEWSFPWILIHSLVWKVPWSPTYIILKINLRKKTDLNGKAKAIMFLKENKTTSLWFGERRDFLKTALCKTHTMKLKYFLSLFLKNN